jgi:AcrR family transcriptional regulator
VSTSTPRTPRADSRRNFSSVLTAARSVFAAEGIDAPLEDIAKAAGVGKGTLYRHFATREHLLAAVLADRWATLGELAAELDAGLPAPPSPDELRAAIRTWVSAYVNSGHEYPGSGAGIAARLAAESEPVTDACSLMRKNFQQLLGRGYDAGVTRTDIDAQEVLILISAVTGAARTSPVPQAATRESRFVDVVLAGIEPA